MFLQVWKTYIHSIGHKPDNNISDSHQIITETPTWDHYLKVWLGGGGGRNRRKFQGPSQGICHPSSVFADETTITTAILEASLRTSARGATFQSSREFM